MEHGNNAIHEQRNGSSAWGDPARLVVYLARLVKDPRVPRSSKLKLVGAGIYGFVDFDIVPDPVRLIPGLGYVDDFILVVHGVKCLVAECGPVVAADLWPGDQASFYRTMLAIKWLDGQLYERLRGWTRRLAERFAIERDPSEPVNANVGGGR